MIAFLDKIAARLLQKFPENMEKVAVVLPSKRAVVFLKHYLSQKIDKPIFLPQFYSIEEFTEKLSGLHVLDNISLQFKLYQTYLTHPPKKVESFDDFLKWSNVLLHDFNEIDRNLVEAESIYTNLRNVKELESWNVEDWSLSETNLTDMQTDYISFFEGMLKWYNDFNQKLIQDNTAYQGLAYRKAAEQISNVEIKWEKVWFVGLNALTKSEQEIVDYLKKEDVARVFWDADKFYYDNKLHEAGGFLREQRAKWSEIDFKGVGDYFNQPKESFDVIACPKNVTQAKVASEVLKDFTKEDLDNSNTAIVLADEALLFPVLHNLPSAIKQLNVTMGSPLKNTTLFAFIEALFKIQINAEKYQNNAFYYKDIISVIEHPYFSKLADVNEVLTFKRFIIKDNIVFVSKSNLATSFKKSKLSNIFDIWRKSDDALSCISKLIEDLKLPLVGVSASIESEVLATFYKSWNILNNLLEDNNFDLDSALSVYISTYIIVDEPTIVSDIA